jgi:hypothetical protein
MIDPRGGGELGSQHHERNNIPGNDLSHNGTRTVYWQKQFEKGLFAESASGHTTSPTSACWDEHIPQNANNAQPLDPIYP